MADQHNWYSNLSSTYVPCKFLKHFKVNESSSGLAKIRLLNGDTKQSYKKKKKRF